MAESTGSRLKVKREDDFWERKYYPSSHMNSGGVSGWCDMHNIDSLKAKVCVGDRLEFVCPNLPCAHWGIYVGTRDILPWNVVHFIPDNDEGRAYLSMYSYGLTDSKNKLFVNTIYKFMPFRGGKLRINNLTDRDWPPLETGAIHQQISCQLQQLHKKGTVEQVYVCKESFSFKDSGQFVNYCRYGKRNTGEEVFESYSMTQSLTRREHEQGGMNLGCSSRFEHHISQSPKDPAVYSDPVDETHLAMTSTSINTSARDVKPFGTFTIQSPVGEIQQKASLETQTSTRRTKVSHGVRSDVVKSKRCRYRRVKLGISDWCNSQGLPRMLVGDRLEFSRSDLPKRHRSIYVGQWGDGNDQFVVHFVPAKISEEEGADSGASPDEGKPVLVVESIEKTLGGGKVRINNNRDQIQSPLAWMDILDEIKRQVPEETHRSACKIRFKDSADFVNYCRYGDWRINFGLDSGWRVSRQSLPPLHVGDRLEFRTLTQPYALRWGMYVGKWGKAKDQVVYFVPANVGGKTVSDNHRSGTGVPVEDKPKLCVSSVGEVVGNGEIRINNERDKIWPPFVRTDILDELGRHLPCRRTQRQACKVSFKDGEHFVNYCRYEDGRINYGVVSEWCDSRRSLPRLHVGDRLEFNRTARPYAHWGIYVGDWVQDQDQVVHLTMADGNGKKFSAKMISGSESLAKDQPELCVNSIEELLLGGIKVRVNNERDYTWPPFLSVTILAEIQRQLDSQESGYGQVYKLFSNNCEHFVNHCRYGKQHSDQVSFFSWVRYRSGTNHTRQSASEKGNSDYNRQYTRQSTSGKEKSCHIM